MAHSPFNEVPLLDFFPQSRLRSDLVGEIERWVNSEPLKEVVEAFGGTPAVGNLSESLIYLSEFSSRHWDFRNGSERDSIMTVDFAADQVDLVFQAAAAFGMTKERQPKYDSYDYLLVLGGLFRACWLRTKRAAQLVDDEVHCRNVALLGANRPLSVHEMELSHNCGFSTTTEIDTLNMACQMEFHFDASSSIRTDKEAFDDANSSLVIRYLKDRLTVKVVAAPSTEPNTRRANTADTYLYWATQLEKVRSPQRILIVTSAIYVPYQHAEAIRMLSIPYGVEVNTIGVSPEFGGDQLPLQIFNTSHYLQEIGSVIRSMRALLDRLDSK